MGKYIVNLTLLARRNGLLSSSDATHMTYTTDRVPGVGDVMDMSVRPIGGNTGHVRGRVTQAACMTISMRPAGLNTPTVDSTYAITVECG